MENGKFYCLFKFTVKVKQIISDYFTIWDYGSEFVVCKFYYLRTVGDFVCLQLKRHPTWHKSVSFEFHDILYTSPIYINYVRYI